MAPHFISHFAMMRMQMMTLMMMLVRMQMMMRMRMLMALCEMICIAGNFGSAATALGARTHFHLIVFALKRLAIIQVQLISTTSARPFANSSARLIIASWKS